MSDAKMPRDAASQAEDALEAGAAVEAEVPEKLSVKANMIWNSIGSMTYLACQWFTTIFVVRLSSGYDDAGLLSLAMSVVGIFGTFANYKMGTYQISDIRRENTVGEYMGFRCFTLAGAFVACMTYAALTCAPEALITVALFYAFKGVGCDRHPPRGRPNQPPHGLYRQVVHPTGNLDPRGVRGGLLGDA